MAQGPTFARYLQQSLLTDESEFCMSIDAHMDVIQDWDVELLRQFSETGNEYAVLSTSVPDIAVLKANPPESYIKDGKTPHLCQAKIDER